MASDTKKNIHRCSGQPSSCKSQQLVGGFNPKNICQNGSFPQVGVKINNIWNHHLVYICLAQGGSSRITRQSLINHGLKIPVKSKSGILKYLRAPRDTTSCGCNCYRFGEMPWGNAKPKPLGFFWKDRKKHNRRTPSLQVVAHDSIILEYHHHHHHHHHHHVTLLCFLKFVWPQLITLITMIVYVISST